MSHSFSIQMGPANWPGWAVDERIALRSGSAGDWDAYLLGLREAATLSDPQDGLTGHPTLRNACKVPSHTCTTDSNERTSAVICRIYASIIENFVEFSVCRAPDAVLLRMTSRYRKGAFNCYPTALLPGYLVRIVNGLG